ncbi:MAG: hypothetical protein HY268_13115, partial [Deltaproteobacteria bacterium]|nr:hypothetical protein [Deltaproteobacteria bacterium]
MLFAIGLFVLSGTLALLTQKSTSWTTSFGVGGIVTGSVIGLIPTLPVLLGAPPLSLHAAWEVPYGSFFVGLDALSAFFLVPI